MIMIENDSEGAMEDIPKKTKQFCRHCGIKLTSKNAYKDNNIPYGFRKICKECDKQERNARNLLRKIRGKNIDKVKLEERKKQRQLQREFRVGRKIQAKYGRGHRSNSSRVGQSVWVNISIREGKAIKKKSVPMKCPSNKLPYPYRKQCNGTIRYDVRNEQVCDECGLVVNDHFNVLTYEITNPKYPPESEQSTWGDPSETIHCYDKYYAQAYTKTRTRTRKHIDWKWGWGNYDRD